MTFPEGVNYLYIIEATGNKSLCDIFIVLAIILSCACWVVWFLKRPVLAVISVILSITCLASAAATTPIKEKYVIEITDSARFNDVMNNYEIVENMGGNVYKVEMK